MPVYRIINKEIFRALASTLEQTDFDFAHLVHQADATLTLTLESCWFGHDVYIESRFHAFIGMQDGCLSIA